MKNEAPIEAPIGADPFHDQAMESAIEAAYWAFDGRRERQEYNGQPHESERDSFKRAVRAALRGIAPLSIASFETAAAAAAPVRDRASGRVMESAEERAAAEPGAQPSLLAQAIAAQRDQDPHAACAKNLSALPGQVLEAGKVYVFRDGQVAEVPADQPVPWGAARLTTEAPVMTIGGVVPPASAPAQANPTSPRPTDATADQLGREVAEQLGLILGNHIKNEALDRRGSPGWWRLGPDDIVSNLHLWERLGVAFAALGALRGYAGGPRGFRLVDVAAEPDGEPVDDLASAVRETFDAPSSLSAEDLPAWVREWRPAAMLSNEDNDHRRSGRGFGVLESLRRQLCGALDTHPDGPGSSLNEMLIRIAAMARYARRTGIERSGAFDSPIQHLLPAQPDDDLEPAIEAPSEEEQRRNRAMEAPGNLPDKETGAIDLARLRDQVAEEHRRSPAGTPESLAAKDLRISNLQEMVGCASAKVQQLQDELAKLRSGLRRALEISPDSHEDTSDAALVHEVTRAVAERGEARQRYPAQESALADVQARLAAALAEAEERRAERAALLARGNEAPPSRAGTLSAVASVSSWRPPTDHDAQHCGINALMWARAFVDRNGGDHALMASWFALAIQRAFELNQRAGDGGPQALPSLVAIEDLAKICPVALFGDRLRFMDRNGLLRVEDGHNSVALGEEARARLLRELGGMRAGPVSFPPFSVPLPGEGALEGWLAALRRYPDDGPDPFANMDQGQLFMAAHELGAALIADGRPVTPPPGSVLLTGPEADAYRAFQASALAMEEAHQAFAARQREAAAATAGLGRAVVAGSRRDGSRSDTTGATP